MKKIMFKDKYGLTQAVLDGRKTMTRRLVPQKVINNSKVYAQVGQRGGNINDARIEYIVHQSPYKIGEVVAIAQSYRKIKKEIEKALINSDDSKSQLEKVGAILVKSITCPTVEKCSRLKHLIGEAYRAVGIKEEAKASDIENWFKCKKTSARIEGITTAVYKIYTPELKYE